ncbi:RNA methyltransferase, RsmE family [Leptospira ryugenii]|uniref:16S rRNA (uracil(1498)-N(3))-methyltransferase n=1 Tax=Leptospira ryugenii TaxID=1917863 RepID=A0A2P2DWK0_9LEPT|nr:RsmE family RNA methyltransferase [Leptospira ryugenii]GBF48992.1 RNA methyltransferase, RsmE family [Leptospira ryugenii]
MNWIVIRAEDPFENGIYTIQGDRHRHIQTILQKKTNDTVRALLTNVWRGICRIVHQTSNETSLQIISIDSQKPIRKEHSFSFALPRPQTGKKIFYLSGCFGIGTLQFFLPETRNQEYLTSPLYRGKEYEDYAKGMSQTGNIFQAEIHYSKERHWKPKTEDQRTIFVFHPEGEAFSDLRDVYLASNSIEHIFGPESGFLENDLRYYQSLGAKIVRLSDLSLRTEDAYLAALYQTDVWLKTHAT